MLASIAAIAASGVSLLMPAPVVAVATEGQWTSIAVGSSAYDCDRVSIWSVKVYRLGRRTSCTDPGHRIAALSEIDNRAVWLHVSGEQTRTWTLWTATTTSPSPKLLARAVGGAGGRPPIVIGPGETDRMQLTSGEGDVMPYAVGRKLTVLNAAGKRTLTWTAPSDVVGLATDPYVLVVAVADGTVYVWNYSFEDGRWVQASQHPGRGAPTRIAYDSLDAWVQRGRSLEPIRLTTDSCAFTRVLRPGERLAAAGGGRLVLATGTTYRVYPGCGRRAVETVTASAFSLDNAHYSWALGRRVTADYLPGA